MWIEMRLAQHRSETAKPSLDLNTPGDLNGSSRNPGKHRNKNADLIDDVRASKHI